MTRLSTLTALLAVMMLALPGCGTVAVDLTSTRSARFLHEENRHNLACDIPVPWAIISRNNLEVGTDPRPLPLSLPRAGFRTAYVRGPDPVPCERHVYQRTDAVFDFDFADFLTRHRPDQIALAILTIEEAPTERDVLIRFAEPWVDNNAGHSGYNTANITSLPFQVKVVRSTWTPMAADAAPSGGRPPEIVEMTEAGVTRDRFAVPLTERSSPGFVVTEEVRRFLQPSLDGPRNFGFAIEPLPDRNVRLYKRFNEVNAAFRVQLRLFVRQ